MKTIILDFETSGLNPYHCDIIEIGAKIVETGDTFSSLIRPKSENPISQKITEITGITNVPEDNTDVTKKAISLDALNW